MGKLLCLLLCLHAPSSLRRSAKCQENERHVLYTIKDLVISNMPIAKTDVSFLYIYLFLPHLHHGPHFFNSNCVLKITGQYCCLRENAC